MKSVIICPLSDFLDVAKQAGFNIEKLPDLSPEEKTVQGRCSTKAKPHKQNGFYQYTDLGGGVVTLFLYDHQDPEHCLTIATSMPRKNSKKREELDRLTQRNDELMLQQRREAMRAEFDRYQDIRPDESTPYLTAKKVLPGADVKCGTRQETVILFRGEDGQPQAIQLIAADGTKKFSLGSAASGAHHTIEGIPEVESPYVFVAEGYATGMSINLATHATVVVAGSATNLRATTAYAKQTFSDKEVVICADNDIGGEDDKRSKNVGLETAMQVARELKCMYIFPDIEGRDHSIDFNDLYCELGAEATRQYIEEMIENKAHALIPADFILNEVGLFREGSRGGPDSFICEPIHVKAIVYSPAQKGYGRLLEWRTATGHSDRAIIMSKDLHGQNPIAIERITRSLVVDPTMLSQLKRYISLVKVPTKNELAETHGWHNDCYILDNDRVIGSQTDKILSFFPSKPQDYEQRGSLTDWFRNVASLARGNPMVTVALCASIAGPLVRIADQDSGGLHFIGKSSCGKSTTLRVAQSVWSSPAGMYTWRSTDNALEFIATGHNDCLLTLDELSQAAPKVVDNAIYMLGNGQGKNRCYIGQTGVEVREPLRWSLVILSSGEESVEGRLNSAGLSVKAGQRVRLIDIPVSPADMHDLHDFSSSAELVAALNQGCEQYCGTAGPEFIRYVAANLDLLRRQLPRLVRQQASEMCNNLGSDYDEQVKRVADRFALYMIAGHLAAVWDIFPFSEEEIDAAFQVLFARWIEDRDSTASAETGAVISAVINYIETRPRDFLPLTGLPDEVSTPSPCAGYINIREGKPTEYLFFVQHFKHIVLKDFNASTALEDLHKNGLLVWEGGKRKYQVRRTSIHYVGTKQEKKDSYLYCIVLPEEPDTTPSGSPDTNAPQQ